VVRCKKNFVSSCFFFIKKKKEFLYKYGGGGGGGGSHMGKAQECSLENLNLTHTLEMA